MPAPQDRNVHLDALDGLRALAITGVVMVHSGQIAGPLVPWLANLTDYGAKGVQLFFVVSGFTLAHTYAGRHVEYLPFIIRRATRILPMFYVGAILYSLLSLIPGFAYTGLVTPWTLLATLTLTHGLFPATINEVVPGGWSIAAEWAFYLLFPIMLTLVVHARVAGLALITIAAIAIGAASYVAILRSTGDLAFSYFFWLSQLPAFVLGIVTQRILSRLKPKLGQPIFWGAAAVLAAISVTNSPLSNFLVADVLFAALVLGAACGAPPFLQHRWMRRTGQVSYSIYIWHFAVLGLLEKLLPADLLGGELGFVFLFAVTLATSYALSSASFRLIERPCLDWGRRVSSRVQERATQKSGTSAERFVS